MGTPEKNGISLRTDLKGKPFEICLETKYFSMSALKNIIRLQIINNETNNPREIYILGENRHVNFKSDDLSKLNEVFVSDEEERAIFFERLEFDLLDAREIVIREPLKKK